MRPLIFTLGGDPAPSDQHRSDDGALVVGAATTRRELAPDEPYPQNEQEWFFDHCYGRVFTAREKLSASQWSGQIHRLDGLFNFERLLIDAGAGGGGVYVKRELMKTEQIINGVTKTVTPLCDQVDGPKLVTRGRFIVSMFGRGDPGVNAVWPDPSSQDSTGKPTKSLAGDELLKDALYSSYKDGIEHGVIGYPPDVDELLATRRDEVLRWGEERMWALKVLDAGRKQLANIMVETREKDGHQVQVFTSRGARKFASLGKDDVALAMMYSYGAFLIWLRSGDWTAKMPEEDSFGFAGR
jgi:hypothetical protein